MGGVQVGGVQAGTSDERPGSTGLHLRTWRSRAVVALALVALSSGFGQFGVVAALGDVAHGFGTVAHGPTIAEQAGLSGTELGVGLAIVRLASLGGLPLAGLADRFGRRRMLLWTAAVGLALTALAAASPGFWFFVAIFACGRPLLSATNGLAGVAAAEETASSDRSKALALVTAGYGVGAGLTAVLHTLGVRGENFRWLFLLALVPLALVGAVRRWLHEPDRFAVAEAAAEHALPVLGAVGAGSRRRLGIVALLAFALSVIAGPANSFAFLYADDVVHQSEAVTAAMVVAAGAAGLGGLLVGRLVADRLGRRVASALGMVGAAGFGVLTYSGSEGALVAGYVLGVFTGSMLAPGLGALVNELFPTSVRASVAGWWIASGVLGAVTGLLAFGALVGAGQRFGLAAVATFLPAATIAALFLFLPETRGHEPEELWPVTP